MDYSNYDISQAAIYFRQSLLEIAGVFNVAAGRRYDNVPGACLVLQVEKLSGDIESQAKEILGEIPFRQAAKDIVDAARTGVANV